MNLPAALEDAAAKQGSKPAIFYGEQQLTYAQLVRQAAAIAAHLQTACGVAPGDRVGLWLKNCPEFVPALFGILDAGAVVVPINNFFKPDEVTYILNDAGINVLITDEELAAHFPALDGGRSGLKVLKVEPSLPG